MSATVLAPPTARLDKRTGCRVLCGRLVNGQRSCDGQLAEIVEYDDHGNFANASCSDPFRMLQIEAGREELQGIWTLSNYARKQVARGGLSGFRRTSSGPD